jgi:hypothetical protein
LVYPRLSEQTIITSRNSVCPLTAETVAGHRTSYCALRHDHTNGIAGIPKCACPKPAATCYKSRADEGKPRFRPALRGGSGLPRLGLGPGP